LDSAAAITTEAANPETPLPLDFFYAILKENGFAVTPLQIINANRVVLQYASWVKNEEELCQYLTPLFAGSEDEQELFKKLFKEHFTPQPAGSHQHAPQKPSVEDRVKKHWKKLLFLYTALALVVLAIIWLTSTRRSDFHPSLVKVFIADKSEPDKTTTATFRAQTNRQFGISISSQYIGKLLPLELHAVFDWGDSTDINALPTHIYLKQGEYRLKAIVNVLYKNDTVKKVIFYRKVLVCPESNTITIQVSKNTDSLFLHETIIFRAELQKGQKPGTIKWLLDGKDAGRGTELQHSFNVKGFYNITCIAVDDSIDTRCNIQKDLSITVHDKAAFFAKKDTANSAAGRLGQIPEAPVATTDIVFLSRLYISLAVAFFILLGFFIVLWLKELKKTGRIKAIMLSRYKKLAASLGADKSPAILPFKNRNYLPVDELDIDAVTKQLRRRVKDNTDFLHIEKTIAKTIEQGGLIQPVKEARTRQTEYLLLIDECNGNSLEVKLFEYLALLLKKHNVLVDTFYYKKEPAICYNANELAGIRLEKMYGKYQRHILLILGNGYQFINTEEKEFNEGYIALLNHWQHKAIITPVPFKDWQYKEKNILLPHIPLLPLDMQGLALLAELFSEQGDGLNITARLNLTTGVFYSTAAISFSSVTALRNYCDRVSWAVVKEENKTINILFEWVAALAVYPTLRWEILLAVGKVILEKYGRGRSLNFTSLLFLVRISWMKNGTMPAALRLDLLKTIQRENELLARETILQLLKEIPEEETPEASGNFAEKEIQQVINEFSLYASDPVYYSSYRQSKYLFKKLWDNNQLTDGPAEEYLKNSSGQWETLLNNSYNNSAPDYKTGAEQYLLSNEKEETLLAKIYLALAVISAAVFVSSLFALRILYIWDNFL
jgi:hypothetical protein